MGYVDNNLLPGEHIIHQTKLHRIIFLFPSIITLFFSLPIVPLIFSHPMNNEYPEVSTLRATYPLIVIWVICLLWILAVALKYYNSEFVITNRRVVVKVGILTRRTIEIFLNKVESVTIDQSILGRILNYGTIYVGGTGGTKSPFKYISNPLEFRRNVNELTEAK